MVESVTPVPPLPPDEFFSRKAATAVTTTEISTPEVDTATNVAVVWPLIQVTSENDSIKLLPSRPSRSKVHSIVVNAVDGRKPVLDKDIAKGGKYRGVVKLWMRYSKTQPGDWYIGSGWVIDQYHIATAGHCAYDSEDGPVVEMNIFTGYKGREDFSEMRKAVKVSTTKQFVTGYLRAFDLAVIKLEKPFTDVVPLSWKPTPVPLNAVIGVVGYPSDKKEGGEGGARMYEMFVETKWQPDKDNTLAYKIDTWKGQSGSPILRRVDGKLDPIGIHTAGNSTDKVNVGTILGGDKGLKIDQYLAAIAKVKSANLKTADGYPFGYTEISF